MKIISKKLYDKIPLFYKLDAMPLNKLLRYAYKHYGITLDKTLGYNKYDVIEDILYAENEEKELVLKKYVYKA